MDQLITNYSASFFKILFQLSVRQLSQHCNLHCIQIMIPIKDVKRNEGKWKEKTRHLVNSSGNRGSMSFVLDLYRILPLCTASHLKSFLFYDRNGIALLLSREITGSLLLKIFSKLSSPRFFNNFTSYSSSFMRDFCKTRDNLVSQKRTKI